MPPKDAQLKQLEDRLRGLKSRKSLFEGQKDEFSRRSLALIQSNILTTEREIRKRRYVISPKSGSKGTS